MAETKDFPTADVLSPITGILVVEDIGRVYAVCNWATGESVYTHQLPRIGRELQAAAQQHDVDSLRALLNATEETNGRLIVHADRLCAALEALVQRTDDNAQRQIADLKARAAGLTLTLRGAAEQFAFYAKQPRAKATVDGDAKAETNETWAEVCRDKAASWKGQADGR